MATRPYSSDSISRGLLESHPRPFGSRFEGQNVFYLVYMPVVLVVCAIGIDLAPTDSTFVFGAFVGGLVGIALMWDLIFNEPPLRACSLLAMSLLVAYNFGAAYSWLTIPREGLTISESFARDPAVLAHGIAVVMGVAAVLLFVGQMWERPIFGKDFAFTFDSRSFLLILVSTALILIAFATGKIGYMGVAVNENSHVSPFGSIVSWIAAPSLAYSLCATLNTKALVRLILGCCTLIQTIALVPTGRRNFTFALLLAVIVSRLGRLRLRLSFFGKLIMLASGAGLVLLASIGFLYLRIAGWEHREATSLGARVRAAIDLTQTRTFSEMTEYLQSNASARTFYIGYLADLIDASQKSTPLLGEDLLRNLQLMVPSAISPDKFGVGPYMEEQQVNIQFGFSYLDESNSILTAGAADFGIIGVFLYPLLAVLLLRSLAELVQATMPTYMAGMIVMAYIYQMLLAEALPTDYFVQVRNTLIVVVILWLVTFLPRTRLPEPDADGPLFRDKLQRLIGG